MDRIVTDEPDGFGWQAESFLNDRIKMGTRLSIPDGSGGEDWGEVGEVSGGLTDRVESLIEVGSDADRDVPLSEPLEGGAHIGVDGPMTWLGKIFPERFEEWGDVFVRV